MVEKNKQFFFEDAAVLFLFIFLLMNFSDFKTHLITA